MAKGAVVFALLALGVAAVQAQNKTTAAAVDFKGTLEKNGYKLAAALFDIADLTKPLSNPAAVYTVLVPSDAAVNTFLQKMGLTVDDLKQRPLLAKELAAQHIILKANVRPAELFENGPARIVATAAHKPNELLFRKLPDGSVKVTDIQGQTANVKKFFTIDENKTAHPIDKVLLPDTVFYTVKDLCGFRPLTLREFCQALVYAGLNSTISGNKVNATIFVPNNRAFTQAIDLSGGQIPSVSKAADLLKYHVVPGYHTLGHGLSSSFKDGQPDQTLLAGQPITVDYTRVKPGPGDSRVRPYANATVLSTGGQKANVLKANVHVGTAIVHGIDGVLLPGNGSAAATTKPAAAAAAPAKAAGRKLLGFGWMFSGGPTAEMDDAASDINAACDGEESVAAAADQSVLGAEELSIPGDYAQVDNGVNPW